MNLQKKEKGGGLLVASPMLKLAKKMKKIRKPIGANRVAYLFPMGGFLCLYPHFSLIFGKIILLCRR